MTINKDIRRVIDLYAEESTLLDKLVVTAFVNNNGIARYGKFIASFMDENVDGLDLFCDLHRIEDVINIFELAIPKADSISNGAIYTPSFVREFIVNECASRCSKPFAECDCADISCGCGAFLMTLADYLRKQEPGTSYQEIYNHLWGVDICEESIRRAKILLSLRAALEGELIDVDTLHLWAGNTLSTKVNDRLGTFDMIFGNPPYVRARHIDNENKNLLPHWEVSRCGNTDLYIPFFEIALKHLKINGVLGFITPNSYFKSVNARLLRKYLADRLWAPTIWNFGEEKIFKKKMVYTCVTLIENKTTDTIRYVRVTPQEILQNVQREFTCIPIRSLDHHKGWNLSTKEVMDNIAHIESVGRPLGELFPIKNGIATLANGVFIFRPEGERGDCYLFKGFEIEKAICRDIVKPNVIRSEEELAFKCEKIIFPYSHSLALLEEADLKVRYPKVYSYLLKNKPLLLLRDKGEGDYPWYAFGRTQAIADHGKKLLFPYMTDQPHFVYTSDEGMLIYCGYAIFDDSEEELHVLKRILESSIFAYYIRHTSKPYSTGYYSYAKNYVKNFGVPCLDDQEKQHLLRLTDQHDIEIFLKRKYGISI